MTAEPLRIDIVSDVVCPWCIIGFRQLELALAETGDAAAAEVRWHPFELNPHMPPAGQDLREHLREKYGASVEQGRATRDRITGLGEALGFTFRYFPGMRIHNTFKAHQLLHWAGEQGRQTPTKLALFEAYFTRRENVDDERVLAAAAARAGLDAEEAGGVLADGRYAEAVRHAEQDWLRLGISAVPAFVFERKYLVSGAQDPAALAALVNRLRGREAA